MWLAVELLEVGLLEVVVVDRVVAVLEFVEVRVHGQSEDVDILREVVEHLLQHQRLERPVVVGEAVHRV